MKGTNEMSRKTIIASIILALILISGIGIYIGLQMTKSSKLKMPKAYKTYKSNLGFSIDYPEYWLIKDHSKRHAVIDYQGGGLLLEIYNFDPQTQPNFPDERKMSVDVDYLRDHYGNPKNIKERVVFLMNTQAKIDVKKVDEFKVSGGEGFLINGKTRGGLFSKVGKEFEFGVFYLRYGGRNSLIYFIPRHVPSNKDYMDLLKAVKVY